MTEAEIPDLNLFMCCDALNEAALSNIPKGYSIRPCRRDELALWKAMPFDNSAELEAYSDFMDDFFHRVYGANEELFFETCLFVCDEFDKPVATAFIWQIHNSLTTFHWLKVVKAYENKGIGRGLVSYLMKALQEHEYPVYLHTQPGSFRAVKLYSDFGFKLLTDPMIGHRTNDLNECLPILRQFMGRHAFENLATMSAPEHLLQTLENVQVDHF